jgi:hypothetical protein
VLPFNEMLLGEEEFAGALIALIHDLTHLTVNFSVGSLGVRLSEGLLLYRVVSYEAHLRAHAVDRD